MAIAADKSKSVKNQPGPFSAVLLAIHGDVRWLIGLVILTEEDRIKAGIYFGGDGHDG